MILQTNELDAFFARVQDDPNLSSTHISLYFVLVGKWIKNDCQPFSTTRRQMMTYAKIHSTATYTRCIYNLETWGYIIYLPSYHPALGSLITLV